MAGTRLGSSGNLLLDDLPSLSGELAPLDPDALQMDISRQASANLRAPPALPSAFLQHQEPQGSGLLDELLGPANPGVSAQMDRTPSWIPSGAMADLHDPLLGLEIPSAWQQHFQAAPVRPEPVHAVPRNIPAQNASGDAGASGSPTGNEASSRNTRGGRRGQDGLESEDTAVDMHDDIHGTDEMGEIDPSPQHMGEGAGASTSTGTSRRRVRSEQQKVSNRHAQRRYRARGKHKALELEVQVEELSQQVQAMAGIQDKRDALLQRNAALQAQVQQQQGQLQSAMPLAQDGGSLSASSSLSLADSWGSLEIKEALDPARGQAICQALNEKVSQLQQLPQSSTGMQDSEADEHCKQLIAAVLELLTASAQLDLFAVSTGGQAGPSGNGSPSAEQGSVQQHATQTVQALQLSPKQRMKLTALRSQHQERMQPVVDARLTLSKDISRSLHTEEDSKPVDIANHPTHNLPNGGPASLKQAQIRAHLNGEIGSMRRLMKEEWKAEAQLRQQVALQILTPKQSVQALLAFLPARPDFVALCEAAAQS
ncbi:hypothetical protein WJX73_000368 [Symbiochloris irregularis]|uniref:BZIP domain-containing protein n=1 Tax=Symbiochloris irregularis TaxID=706552 RepID=A0AAW1NPI3_9CHLO